MSCILKVLLQMNIVLFYMIIRNQTWQAKEGLLVLINFTLVCIVNCQIVVLHCKVLYVRKR